MQFGYFTLSDNHYVDNRHGANQLIAGILDEALYADEIGMHSAWIGEHHFSTLGVLPYPDPALMWLRGRAGCSRRATAAASKPIALVEP